MIICKQFPELCPLQQMNYTVIVTDEAGMKQLPPHFKMKEYTGDNICVEYPITTGMAKEGTIYSIVVFLETDSRSEFSAPTFVYYNG